MNFWTGMATGAGVAVLAVVAVLLWWARDFPWI